MKAFINQQLISQTVLDSGALGMLSAVIHSFPEPGEYHGEVSRAELAVATFNLSVTEQSSATQVDIDLAALARASERHASTPFECEDAKTPDEPQRTPHFTVSPRGYTLFYVSQGTGGYAVRIGRINERGVLFDSRTLQNGDLFAATLIRPGSYSVTNVTARAKGELTVAYPKPGKTAFRPRDPVTIVATDKGLFVLSGEKESKLEKLGLEATQGQIYRIKTPSRIRIELLKPDDGPTEKRPGGILSWRKQASLAGQPGDRDRPARRARPESAEERPKAKRLRGYEP